MAWREQTSMSEREAFVALVSAGVVSFQEACRRFAISRKTGYKWVERAQSGAEDWSRDRSRRPHTAPTRTADAIEAQIVAARLAHPAWGGRKLHYWLKTQGLADPPAPSTITAILRRQGLLADHDPTQLAPRRFAHPRPNDLWQLDFMGHLPMTTGRLHPLTLIDDHSRFALGLWACGHERGELVQAHLTSVFQRCGLPVAILTDNGPPWGAMGGGGITRFEAWLIQLGIQVRHGQPYHPQTQGKVERLHRTIAAEVTATRHFADLDAAQTAFDAWRRVYNQDRPHEALDFGVPNQRYTPSVFPFPDPLPPIDYGEQGPDCQVRLVRGQGAISFRNRSYFISRGLIGQPVAIKPTATDGQFAVYFCHRVVAQIDLTDPLAV